jgi:glycosyltransferase involved in cell wall biosynthesis
MVVTNSLAGGGAERSMNLVCNELNGRDIPIALVPINSGPADQILPECEIFPLKRRWRGGLVNTLVAVWKFKQVVRSWRPTLIVLNCDLPELFGASLLGKHRFAVVEHSSIPWRQRKLLGRLVRRVLEFRGAAWVAVSSHLKIWPGELQPTAILQNPMRLSSRTISPGIGMKISKLIFIGRLSSEKRPDWALKISDQTLISLAIVGEGSMRTDLEDKAQMCVASVYFLGRLSDPFEICNYGDLLIIPSETEGDGLVLIEAIQHGFPILVSDIPEFRRFGLPEENYCKTVSDFASRVELFRENLENLIIPSDISIEILDSRSLKTVGDSWVEFLATVSS